MQEFFVHRIPLQTKIKIIIQHYKSLVNQKNAKNQKDKRTPGLITIKMGSSQQCKVKFSETIANCILEIPKLFA